MDTTQKALGMHGFVFPATLNPHGGRTQKPHKPGGSFPAASV
ncbi:hypothetical protein [Kaarinaea lacus]